MLVYKQIIFYCQNTRSQNFLRARIAFSGVKMSYLYLLIKNGIAFVRAL